MRDAFQAQYGPWALIAGATEGIGAAYSQQLAAQGFNLVMIARHAEPLAALAEEIEATQNVEVRALVLDLAAPDFMVPLRVAIEGLDVGLCVYNAAASNLGYFVNVPLANKMQEIDVNVRGPMLLLDHVIPSLVARGRGGIILMSSLAGFQGGSVVATYAATKSFMRVLAEGLWAELRPQGVDVLACVAGATDTPKYRATKPDGKVPTQPAADVAALALRSLGKKPVVVSGLANKLISFIFGRLLPKMLVVRLMSSQLNRIYGPDYKG
jgi:uncharacterized protein